MFSALLWHAFNSPCFMRLLSQPLALKYVSRKGRSWSCARVNEKKRDIGSYCRQFGVNAWERYPATYSCNDCRALLTSVEKLKARENFSDIDEHPAVWNTGHAYPGHRLELLARDTTTDKRFEELFRCSQIRLLRFAKSFVLFPSM